MSFENGDIVRVSAKNSMHTGKEGVIVNAYGDQESLLVRLGPNHDVGFFASEVEMVEDQSEIEHIASALVEEGNFPSYAHALDAAHNLYKAGVRFTEGTK